MTSHKNGGESVYRRVSLAMIDMKKFEDISGEAYVQPSNANRRVLLTF